MQSHLFICFSPKLPTSATFASRTSIKDIMLSKNRQPIEGKAARWTRALTGHQKSLHWGDQNNFMLFKKQDDKPRVKTGDPSKPWENVRFHYQELYAVA